MTIKVQTPDGGTAHFPDGTDAATIEGALNAAFPPQQEASSQTGDIVKSAGTGVVKGLAGAATMPQMMHDLAGTVGGFAAEQTVGRLVNAYKTGGQDWSPAPHPEKVDTVLSQIPSLPRQDDVVKGVESVVGPLHKPETKAGKFAETIGEFGPMSLAGPGGWARNLAMFGVAPAVASEAAGQYTEGTAAEPFARVGGALAGGVGGILGNKALTGASNFTATKSAANEIGGILNQPNISPGAVRRVATSIGEDGLTPAAVQARAAELGPDAMLLDMGRQMGGRAEAIAAQPGRGQNKVLDAVEQRTGQFGEKTAERIKETLDKFVGPSPNIVETQKRVDQVVDALATPQYKQVMSQHPVVWDDTLATLAERPVIRQGMKDAVSLAKNYGEDTANLGQRTKPAQGSGVSTETGGVDVKPSLQYWDYVKKSIDHRINARMEKGGLETLNGKEKADLGGLMDAKKALTDYLDQITNGEYALARKLSSTKFEVREAGEVGRKAFQNNLLPEEFAARIADMTLPEQTMAKAHMRREIERVIDTARNDGAAARRFLDTTQNGQKIEAIFGKEVLTEIEKRLAAETQFQTIKGKVADNSRTAVRGELIKDTADTSVGSAQGTTLTGLVHAGGRGGLNYIRNQGLSKTREGIADLLTTKGPEMQQLVEIMSGLANKRALNTARSPTRLPLSLVPNSLLALQAPNGGK
ncbi:hypothetical protein AB7714_28350 [Tardiphaga sp. 1201_B9_N1_1]|uniref:hypothetical protein n=1 Tax=unclassified Tardiphaga TaxID=2631404 RepID=UPI003F27205D